MTAAGELKSGYREGASDLVSRYIDDTYYERLRTDLHEWQATGVPLAAAERDSWEALLLNEAWLLDRGRLREWLDLYAVECLYWVPANAGILDAGTGDPQRQVTIACDDRRRLNDRIAWLETGLAYSQFPPSQTAHQVTGFLQIPTAVAGEVKIRSSFVVHEYRATRPVQSLAGWCGHVLVHQDGELRIARKLVSLVGADQGHHNLTFLL